jgi:uncharacterized surface protein with fasciclin (FAS1) repeats
VKSFGTKLTVLVFVFALLVAFAPGSTSRAEAAGLAQIRVAHFSPDTPAVQIYINGELSAIEALNFGDVTGWIQIPAGTYSIAVAPAGTSIDAAAIGPANLTFRSGTWTTIAAIGSLSAGTLKPALISENYSRLASGNARVTVFHGIEDAPAVDVILADGTVLTRGLAFGRTATLNVPAGVYDIQVVPSGATSPIVINLPGTDLVNRNYYFVAAINRLAAPEVALRAINLRTVDALPKGNGTITDVAAADGRFTTLVAALQATGLDAALRGNGPFTVFAPTDAAFAALPEGTVEALLNDLPTLSSILLYHVVPGKLLAEDVVGTGSFRTLQGGSLGVTVDANGNVFINGAQVIITDIETYNGVIHVIDAVLIP